MSHKPQLLLALLISLLPLGALRRLGYTLLLGYRIPASSSVGLFTVIAVKSFQIGERSTIGTLNLFKGPIDVRIGNDARIGRSNRFTCSWHIVHERFRSRGYTPVLTLGSSILILNQHFFDVYGEVSIGNGSWIAGYSSQFWTHGLSVTDRDIRIGSNNYIGSAVRFAPGTSIGDDNIVALGSVVLSKLDVKHSLISGFPAKAVRSIAEDQQQGKYRFSFEDW